VEVGALRRAQHLRRPRERTTPGQQHLRHAGRGSRAQHRADVAGILDIFEQQAEARRRRGRRARRGDQRQDTDAGRQRRELGEQRRGNDQRPLGKACRERRDARTTEAVVGDNQHFGGAAAVSVDPDQVLAFEHALAALAAVA
jgi:hypothetical protein